MKFAEEYDAFRAWVEKGTPELERSAYADLWLAPFSPYTEPEAAALQMRQAKLTFGWAPPCFANEPKHGLILADPAWPYENFRDSANGAVASAYDTMSIDDIAGLRVGDRWAAPNAVLALWVTGMVIVEGHLDYVLREWGFTPKTILPWLKCSPTSAELASTIGIWFRANAEYMVFATRGKIGGFFTAKFTKNVVTGKMDREVKRLRWAPVGCLYGDPYDPFFWEPGVAKLETARQAQSAINAVSGHALIAPRVPSGASNAKKNSEEKQHSRKPETLREYCETFEGPYIELFAQTKRSERWRAWGRKLGQDLGPTFGVRPYNNKTQE